VTILAGWMAAVGYTLQLYFDFSAYSDMALGLGRFFGVRLPMNFDSPLRASSIIDFWRRWHMTLTRFLTAYIYNPLVLNLTRRRLAQGKTILAGKRGGLGAYMTLLAFPTMLVMLVSGVWHGAGFQFAIWGLLHGVYLCCNHAWRELPVVRRWRGGARYARIMQPVGFLLTFFGVVISMVFFGSPSVSAAVNMLQGMAGLHGADLPGGVFAVIGRIGTILKDFGFGENFWWDSHQFLILLGWTITLLVLALAGPNTLQIVRWDAKSDATPAQAGVPKFAGIVPIRWSATVAWAVIVTALAAVAVVHMGGPSEFLYWQF
jgi:hypothetical protein